MPVASANGVSLYYELRGAGERLLFISGTGADLRRTGRLTEGPGLDGFTLLQFDQRGLGRSEVPPGPYTMAQYGDDAAGLLDAVGWEDCLVLGVSFGGMVAQELVLRHPDRVRRLVLACTSSGGAGGASFPLHELVDVPPDEGLARRLQLLDTRWDAAWQKANPETVQMFGEGFQLFQDGGRGMETDGPNGLVLQLQARAHHDTAERLGGIRCPTLVCGGRFDGIAPPENSEFLAQKIPGARLELFDGGHVFFMQDPAAFPTMVDFLRSDTQEAATP
jgi:3-oxoadipate enol-lactonase